MTNPNMGRLALEEAIAYVGGQGKLGRKIGRRQSRIWDWLRKGVPADACPAIEGATDGRITRAMLRPDIFGDLEPKKAGGT